MTSAVLSVPGEGVGFAHRAGWARAAYDLEVLALELDWEEDEWRAGEERRRRREQRRAQRRGCRKLLGETLEIHFLRGLRDRGWQPLGATLGALDALIPDVTAREWFALTGARAEHSPADEAHQGRGRLRRKVLGRLRRRRLVEVRTSGGLEEVRCTPRPPQGFALDEEFEHFLPRPTDEVSALEEELLADGWQEPLVVWREGNVLAEGYERFRFLALIGGSYAVEYRDFPDRQAVRDWLWQRQGGRRRCSPRVTRYFVGRQYNALKERQGVSRPGTSAQRALLNRTADLLGQEHGLTPALVERCAAFAAAVDQAAEACGDDLRVWMLSRR